MTRMQFEQLAARRRAKALRQANYRELMRPDDYRSRSSLTSNRAA